MTPEQFDRLITALQGISGSLLGISINVFIIAMCLLFRKFFK